MGFIQETNPQLIKPNFNKKRKVPVLKKNSQGDLHNNAEKISSRV